MPSRSTFTIPFYCPSSAAVLLSTLLLILIRPMHAGQSNVTRPSAASVTQQQITASANAFGVDFFHTVRATTTGNVFFSPLSLFTTLGMLFAGASGKTRTVMKETMRLPTRDAKTVNEGFLRLLQALNSQRSPQAGMRFSMANRIYVETAMPVRKSYIATLRQFFLSSIKGGTFNEKLRQTINSWVAQETQQQIKELLKPGVVTKNTKLVLVNAVYFKGLWETAFRPELTRMMDWYFTPTNITQVPTMSGQRVNATMYYSPELQTQYHEIPFRGNMSMYLMKILPPSRTSGGTEAGLNSSILQTMLTAKPQLRREFLVTLPKFKLHSDLDLKDFLLRMGLQSMFQSRAADFSRLTRDKAFAVGCGVQQSVIEVNEQGAEAAAASAFTLLRVTMASARYDGPFLSFIVDKVTNAVIFFGRVVDPRQT